MTENQCCVCGRGPLTKDEVALTKKLIDRKALRFYCLSCLAESLGVTREDLLAKIKEFKEEGCELFR